MTDRSDDDSGGSVEITGGGVHHRFVEMRFNSQIGKGIEYMILAYTDEPVAAVNSSTFL